MVFLVLLIIVFFVWQLHDTLKGSILEGYMKRYNCKKLDELKMGVEEDRNFIITMVVYLLAIFIEILLLIYLAVQKILYPFSLIVLAIYLFAVCKSFFKKTKKGDKGIVRYKKPTGIKWFFKKALGVLVIIFYLAVLYKLFIGW